MNQEILFNTMFAAPENPAEWVMLIGAIVLVVAIIGAAVWMSIQLMKDGKIGMLKDAIIAAIKEAEKTHLSGAEKKEMVIAAAKKFCDEIGLHLNETLLGWIADYIDRYVFDHNELKKIEEEGKPAPKAEEPKPASKRRKK